jgi:hypothetical protein
MFFSNEAWKAALDRVIGREKMEKLGRRGATMRANAIMKLPRGASNWHQLRVGLMFLNAIDHTNRMAMPVTSGRSSSIRLWLKSGRNFRRNVAHRNCAMRHQERERSTHSSLPTCDYLSTFRNQIRLGCERRRYL